MSDEPVQGAFGRCYMIKKIPSRGVSQIVIEVPMEFHAAATSLFDEQDCFLVKAPTAIKKLGRYGIINGEGENEMQQTTGERKVDSPYGTEASELYKGGFWLVPTVLQALGTDEEYRKWIQTQPCIVCNEGDLVEEIGEKRCEAAHVKRPSNSGMKDRPEYSCVPLDNQHHVHMQHQHGLAYLYQHHLFRRGKIRDMPSTLKNFGDEERQAAREWMDKQRNNLLIKWAVAKASELFKVESTRFIEPSAFAKWASERGLTEYLPDCYRRYVA